MKVKVELEVNINDEFAKKEYWQEVLCSRLSYPPLKPDWLEEFKIKKVKSVRGKTNE